MSNETRIQEVASSGMSPAEEVQHLKAAIWSDDYIPPSMLELSQQERQEALRALPLIVAEGNSWFDYPVGMDVLDQLRRIYGYKIIRFGLGGDTLENMAYGTDIHRTFRRKTPQIEEVVAAVEAQQPKFLLFSAGGNDVAGDELFSYLNHKASRGSNGGRDWLREDVWASALAQMEAAIRHFAGAIWDASGETRIVMHGYANPVPDGRAVINAPFGFKFIGPWLRPAFARKGYEPWQDTEPWVARLLEDYNSPLARIAGDSGSRFHYVDTRPAVGRDQWANELHPTNAGFAAVARKIHEDVLQHL